MPKSRTRRKHSPAVRRGASAPPLYGPRQLRALTVLADPPPLDPVLDADAPDHDARIPADAVAQTWAGMRAALVAAGRQDLLGCEIAVGFRQAAQNGTGLTVPPFAVKALWVFCDAFAPFEPALRRPADGLRVVVA